VFQVDTNGAVFIKAVDTTGHKKKKRYIASLLIGVIESLGVSNVVQVITDSASNCKAAGQLVHKKYGLLINSAHLLISGHAYAVAFFCRFPSVTWTPCTAHCIDLFLEDVGKLSWALSAITDAKNVVKFITAHSLTRDLYRKYSSKDGVWGHDMTWKLAKVVPAHAWWMEYSAAAPDLAEVAIRVLSQVSSACCCERNWSTYDFIHSKLRNRLTPARAESLVYVFSNLRLLKKSTDVSYEEEFPEWAEDVPAPTVDWDSDDEFDEFVE
jgi:Protein of unknown function (DUF 659)/hAT family C-terminal dimerisation region